MSFNSRSFLVPFACHVNAGCESIYNECRTNAAAEASYDRAQFLGL